MKKGPVDYRKLCARELAAIATAAMVRGDESELLQIEGAACRRNDANEFWRIRKKIWATTTIWGVERLKLEVAFLRLLSMEGRRAAGISRKAILAAIDQREAFDQVAVRLAEELRISADAFWTLSTICDVVSRPAHNLTADASIVDEIYEQFKTLAY